jgi:hypothetical protein
MSAGVALAVTETFFGGVCMDTKTRFKDISRQTRADIAKSAEI